MKVLHVINHLGTGGAEKLLVESMPLFQQRGIDINVLAIDGTDYPFMQQLKEMNCCTIFILAKGQLYNPLHIFRLIKFLRKFDLIHVHLFPALYYVGIAKFLSRSTAKLIFTEHSTKNTRIRYSFFRTIDRLIYKNYNLVTAITPQVKQTLKQKLKLKNRIEVVYNGINLSRFKGEVALRAPFLPVAEARILIQVSRFTADKDQETVVRAMMHLPENVCLLLVGDGALKANCEQLVDSLHLNHRVKFLGVRLDIPALLTRSDIVIQSSNWEGFGLAAVEGMAAGKPVIASAVPGLNEIVKSHGLTFESKNEKDLANKVNSLLFNDQLYNEVATSCLLRANDFSINKMLDSFVTLYNQIILSK